VAEYDALTARFDRVLLGRAVAHSDGCTGSGARRANLYTPIAHRYGTNWVDSPR
jgi:hypothetical protein